MNRKRNVILTSIMLLSLFVTHLATAGQEESSDITLANIEALSTNERPASPCHAAGGYCITTTFPTIGVHFAED